MPKTYKIIWFILGRLLFFVLRCFNHDTMILWFFQVLTRNHAEIQVYLLSRIPKQPYPFILSDKQWTRNVQMGQRRLVSQDTWLRALIGTESQTGRQINNPKIVQLETFSRLIQVNISTNQSSCCFMAPILCCTTFDLVRVIISIKKLLKITFYINMSAIDQILIQLMPKISGIMRLWFILSIAY